MRSDGQERTERRLAAVLAADVVGYSRLMGKDEEGTLFALKAVRREVSDPRIEVHRGRIVKTTGDGLLVEFASVVDAVRCAVDIQREMAARNARNGVADPIVLRIGINMGDIIIDEADIFGDGVNVAARLEGLAPPGGICVSRIVRDQVRDKLGFGFEDMGALRVKNIARPVRVFRIPLDEASPAPAAGSPPPAARVAGAHQSHRHRPPVALIAAFGGSAAVVGAALLLLQAAPWSAEPPGPAAASSPTIGDAVLFDRDQVVLSRSAGPTIDRQAVLLRDHPAIAVTIRVYCSSSEGVRAGAQVLAQLRANQIRDALKTRGIAGDRIKIESGCHAASPITPVGAAGAQERRAVLMRD